MSSNFKEVPLTNEFGEVIFPGDVVIFAGTSWKSTKIRRGVYKGLNINKHTGKPTSARVVGVVNKRFAEYNKETNRWEYINKEVERISFLQLMRVYKSIDNIIGKSF